MRADIRAWLESRVSSCTDECMFKVFVVFLVVWRRLALNHREVHQPPSEPAVAIPQPLPDSASPQLRQLLASATEQTTITTGYDPAYVSLKYPGGDVPIETGVCSDVLVRAFRKAGVDLQKEVHEDMTLAWSAYPRAWGAARPDTLSIIVACSI